MEKPIPELMLRSAVRAKLQCKLVGERDVIVDELLTPDGLARIDLALVNGKLAAYELKSDFDSLRRLPMQHAALGPYFDQLSVVVTGKHLDKASSIIPPWWGIFVGTHGGDDVKITMVRNPRRNPERSLEKQLHFLWKEDLVELAKSLGLSSKKPYNLSKPALCSMLASASSTTVLGPALREAMKVRIPKKLALR